VSEGKAFPEICWQMLFFTSLHFHLLSWLSCDPSSLLKYFPPKHFPTKHFPPKNISRQKKHFLSKIFSAKNITEHCLI